MYKDKKIIHIVARDSKGGIGKDNSLLWNIPEDMKFFRESTLGHVCLVGRKTAESFPKPLSRRVVFCISSEIGNKSDKFSYKSVSLESALSVGHWQSNQLKSDKIFIIGGQHLYESTFDIADELWVTEVSGDFGADKFYNIPKGFHKFSFTDFMGSTSGHNYQLTRYLRNENVSF